jgi:4-aminobutyrate aminotransferase/(S)-3-amino-2-methylpropionate transaminase
VPDVITMAKSMAGGFPISAVIGKAEIMDKPLPGGLGGTYAGNPLACAAALAVLDVFEEEKLLDRAKGVGETLVTGLKAIAAKHRSIGEVRAMGAMVAVELFKNGDVHPGAEPPQAGMLPSGDGAQRQGAHMIPDPDLTKRVCVEALKRGLVLLSCGAYANVVRILVPLTVPQAQLEEGLGILAQAFDAAAA